MKQIFRILIYCLIIGLFLAGIFLIHKRVIVMWRDVALRQAVLQDAPRQASQTAALKKDLDSALLKMQSINATIPTNDQLVDVISAISKVVTASGVSAQVPIVKENVEVENTESTDIFTDVHIYIVASGSPAALASFLYRIEHLPYVLHVVSWKIDTIQQAAVTSFTANGQTEAPGVAPQLGSSLEADIVVVTKKESLTP
jgi:hypothetical protein